MSLKAFNYLMLKNMILYELQAQHSTPDIRTHDVYMSFIDMPDFIASRECQSYMQAQCIGPYALSSCSGGIQTSHNLVYASLTSADVYFNRVL